MKFKRRHSSPTNSPQQRDTEQRSRARSNTFPGQETEPIETSFASTRGFRASNFLPGDLKFSRKSLFKILKSEDKVSKQKFTKVKTHDTPDLSELPPGGDPIPQELHFFWKGDSPGRDLEWQNLQQWGNMGQRSAGWNMTLWTDRDSYNEWQQNQQQQLNELARLKIEVKLVETEIDPQNKFVYDHAVRHDARTMVSDVARYNVLRNHGGIYVDLDIAPGNLSLPNSENQEGEILTSGKLPFLAPRVIDKDNLNNFAETDTFEEKLRKTIEYQYEAGAFGNNLIAVESNNPTIELVIDKISKIEAGEKPDDLKSDKKHLYDIAPRVTGPIAIGKVMLEQMKQRTNPIGLVPEAYKHMNLKLKDSSIDKMQLLTDASEQT